MMLLLFLECGTNVTLWVRDTPVGVAMSWVGFGIQRDNGSGT